MQESDISVRLFSRSYSVRSHVERLLFLLAIVSIVLHGWLLYNLIAVRDIHSAITFLYLFSLLPFSLFLASVWLDKNPGYQRHLTLLPTGVTYRQGFMQREHAFDWEEVERIRLVGAQLVFELKNDEVHEVSLESVHREQTLQQIKDWLGAVGERKGIDLYLDN